MSFLLSSFFAVLVSSTIGLLSVPLHWVFSASALSWASAVLGFLLAGAVQRLFQPG